MIYAALFTPGRFRTIPGAPGQHLVGPVSKTAFTSTRTHSSTKIKEKVRNFRKKALKKKTSTTSKWNGQSLIKHPLTGMDKKDASCASQKNNKNSKRNELLSNCRHVDKHLLRNFKHIPQGQWNKVREC